MGEESQISHAGEFPITYGDTLPLRRQNITVSGVGCAQWLLSKESNMEMGKNE